MRNILICLAFLIGSIASAQVVTLGGYTSAQIATLSPGTGKYPILYNESVGQFQRWNGTQWQSWDQGAGGGEADGVINNVALSGNNLTFTGVDGGFSGTISLASFKDNTDAQQIGLSGNTLSLTNGGSVSLAGYLDNTDTQDLSLASNTLSLTNGGSVSLLPYLDNTDDQTASEVAFTPNGSIAATNVQAAIQEVRDEAGAGSDDQVAAEVPITDAGGYYTGVQVEAALQEVGASLATKLETVGVADLNAEDFGDFTVAAGVASLDNNVVGSAEIATDAVGADEIAANAVGASEIATDAVGNAELQALSVSSGKIQDNAVNSDKIADGSVTMAKLDKAQAVTGLDGYLLVLDEAGDQIDFLDPTTISGGTDDQTATEVFYDNTASGILASDVQTAIDVIEARGAEIADGDKGDITVSGSGASWYINRPANTTLLYGRKLTQAQYNALPTAQKFNDSIQYYIIPSAPSAFTVTWDDSPVTETEENSTSFTFASATIDAGYDYSITSSGGGSAVTGFGTISSASQQVTGVNVSSLGDGTLTLAVSLTNGGGTTAATSNPTVTKDTSGAGSDLFQPPNSTAGAVTAGGNEANSVGGFTIANGVTFEDLDVITDPEDGAGGTGGTYALRLVALQDGWVHMLVNVSGLSLTPHTATIRMRSNSASTGVFNWANATVSSYDSGATERTDEVWYTRTVTFTPTTGTVTMRFYADTFGGSFTAGQYIEVSEITITED